MTAGANAADAQISRAEIPPADIPLTDESRGGAGSSRRALTRAASGSFALNVFNTVAIVATTAVLARVMDVASFGIYSWVVATATLLTVPAVLGVDRLLVRDVAVNLARGAFGQIRGLIRWTTALVLATSIALALAGILVLVALGDADPLRFWPLVLGLVSLPLLATSRVVQSALMGLHNVVLAQIPELLLRPVVFLALVVAVVLAMGTPMPAEIAVLLYGISIAAGLATGFVLMRRRVTAPIGKAAIEYQGRAWAAAAIALALLSAAAIVSSQTGIVLLGVLDTPESAGLYAVAQRGAQLIAFPLLAVNAALAPMAARLWTTGGVDELQSLVTRSARGVLLMSIPVAALFIVAGGTVLQLLFGGPFVAGGPALAILSIGQLANAATGSVATLLIMSGNQWRAGLGILAGMLLNVGLSLVLIPSLHTQGAAMAAAVGLIVSNGIHVFICRRTLGIDSTAIGLRAVLRHRDPPTAAQTAAPTR